HSYSIVSIFLVSMNKKGRIPNLVHREKRDDRRGALRRDVTLRVIGGRWKILILKDLFTGTRRFSEIHRTVQGITQKMLTQQLGEMERHGIVSRQVYAEVPPKVEYSLTPLGKSLWPVLMAMHQWGLEQLAATMDLQRTTQERGS
ncbi:helix-turn-helix transcriptional regulator, partial [Acidithiobacillus ferrooxidans]|uniref:winged helix-turn-helix transcriptional regulator n=1 Tax=Acidithiobacillus ferrooxidans TaxID=920 RepID=UPI00214CBEA4